MIAWRLGIDGVMLVDLLLWARWAILEGRLAPACSMGNMGSPIGIVDVASCGRLSARAWMRRDGAMGNMGNMGSQFLIGTPLQINSTYSRNSYFTRIVE